VGNDRKRLFLDIETSQILVWVFALNDKANQHISHLNIEKEPDIICIAWKWEGQKKVHHLTWDKKQNSKKMLQQFVPELETADEIIIHNDDFDVKWIRGQCLLNGVPMSPKVPSVCTLKQARSKFRLPSNRLDYLMRKAGIGEGKRSSGLALWHAIQRVNCPKSMRKMVFYCKGDVLGLETVYHWMAPYIEPKTSIAKFARDCPECASPSTQLKGIRRTLTTVWQRIRCRDCGKSWQVAKSKADKNVELAA
jgi:hypothetical protein